MLRVSMHCSCIHNDACMHVRAALRRVVAYCVSSVIHATCSTPAVRASESGSSSCRPLLNILTPCVFNAFVRTLVLCYVELILLAVRLGLRTGINLDPVPVHRSTLPPWTGSDRWTGFLYVYRLLVTYTW